MSLQNKVSKLERAVLPPQGAELDRLIEIEIDRVGEATARAIYDELVREHKLDEPAKQGHEVRTGGARQFKRRVRPMH